MLRSTNKNSDYLHLTKQRSETTVAVQLFEQLDTDLLRTRTSQWYALWEVDNPVSVDVKVNRRLSRTLGICRPANASIGLNAILLTPSNEALLEETLCHELAHLITYQRYGREARPHGHEWASLMISAGFRARVQIPSDEVAGYVPGERRSTGGRRKRYEYEHYCPACDAVMVARRTNYRWRCAPCLNAGRSGELTVTRRTLVR